MTGRRIRIRGQVQGVGFRPFVCQLAQRMGVTGEVLNDAEGVLIHARGTDLDWFEAALRAEAPPLSRIDALESAAAEVAERTDFVIAASGGPGAETRVAPDAATCADCAAEIADPGARRYRYPFTNCTNCGPRFTILRGLPYDRAQTTMAPFKMCAACRAEYADPADRRFHAQPVACPDCGPRAWLELAGESRPAAEIGALLAAGGIVAVKGLGGFHLCCNARNREAIQTLRDRKRRPAKPLALMANLETIRAHAVVSAAEMTLLRDPAAPIVLLAKAGRALPDALAPGQATLGWMLPYTPLHQLLLSDWAEGPLVMTSGNLSGEPQVIGNDEARTKLAAFADGYLMHDREIARRLDDGVERIGPAGRMVLRRARGRVPGTLPLPPGLPDRPVMAYGGQLKSAICLVKTGQALLGHHMGDLDNALSLEEFQKADRDYAALFEHRPEAVAVDLHPDFQSSRYGAVRAEALGRRCVRVQHHHAHMAGAMGENLWPAKGGKVAGIILDGLGLGTDGTIWGGELLLGGYASFERRAWLAPAPLVGGDRAQIEPWRNALVRLDAAGLADWADALFPEAPRDLVRHAAAQGLNAPLSSSAGRLFDAAAACLGIAAETQSFEGEAAMALEALARADAHGAGYRFAEAGPEIDPRPVFKALRRDLGDGVARGEIAQRFHRGLAKAFAARARALVETGEAAAVALSGGCFQNALLLAETLAALDGLRVLLPKEAPANDGGLAYGQALVALAQMEAG